MSLYLVLFLQRDTQRGANYPPRREPRSDLRWRRGVCVYLYVLVVGMEMIYFKVARNFDEQVWARL